MRENRFRRAYLRAQKKALKKQGKYLTAKDETTFIKRQVLQLREDLKTNSISFPY